MKKTNKVKRKQLKRNTKKLMHQIVKKGGTSVSSSNTSSDIAQQKVIEQSLFVPTIQKSNPLTEKAKQTVKSIYDKMAENSEATLGIATIGATMLAVPLILTLAG